MNLSYNEKIVSDKIKGSLALGAVGDALGYPIEFWGYDAIMRRYGDRGITELELDNSGVALVSDDTQMTLFTANGILNANGSKIISPDTSIVESIHIAYKEWLTTQRKKYDASEENIKNCKCWILKDRRLWDDRAPGNTCLEALRSNKRGSIFEPLNNSKGCGGVMRVAPIGLYAPKMKFSKSYKDIFVLGCDVSALTHGHPLGWLSAGVMADIIARIVYTNEGFRDIINQSLADMDTACGNKFEVHRQALHFIINEAIRLSGEDLEPARAIDKLGQGFVAEEALAIAIYCTLKSLCNIEKALIMAVNHSGDSDSTGAITGNIVGAICGYESIPRKFLNKLELLDMIITLADDMNNSIDEWANKYIRRNTDE